MTDDMQIITEMEHSLETALEEAEATEAKYQIRSSLQHLEVLTEPNLRDGDRKIRL